MYAIKKYAMVIFLLSYFLQRSFIYSAEPKFHAVYNCIFDYESDNLFINQAVMSKEGNVVVCYGVNSSNKPVLYKMNSDGSNFSQIALPQYVIDAFGGIKDITINGNGTIIYFYSGFRIYKIINNNVIQIFDSETDSDEIYQFNNLQTTYDGVYLFFKTVEDYRGGSVWQIDQNGTSLAKIIEPKNVTHNLGKGAGLSAYSISDNAGEIAFLLLGYWDNDDAFHYDHELFVMNNLSSVRQLTFNEESLNASWVDISGDGSKIVFHKKNYSDSLTHYYSINSDGSNETMLAHIDVPGHKDMDYGGSTMLLNDSRSNGRLVTTDGSSEFDIMLLGLGLWKTSISFSYTNKTCFISNNIGTKGVYVGTLYIQDTELYNPVIDTIYFDPNVFPKNNPETKVKLKAKIRNHTGINEINYTGVRCLYDGIKADYDDCQIWFEKDLNDLGTYDDEIAGDGIFTTSGNSTQSFNDSTRLKDQIYVRVVTRNTSKCYAVQDVMLYIRNAVGVDDKGISLLPAEYSLSQNYPNPFNPSTIIKYSLKNNVHVNIKIYDMLGREVKTLINKNENASYKSITWNGENNIGAKVSSGLYIYRISAGEFTRSRKMILLK